MIGNEFDEIFEKKMEKLEIDNELYSRYVDDIDLFVWSIGRGVKFCPRDGCMVEKSPEEILADEDKNEDEITMEELRKIADTCIEHCSDV